VNWFPSAVVTGPQKADIKRTSGGNYRQEAPVDRLIGPQIARLTRTAQDETIEAADLTFLLNALNLNYPS